MATPYIPVIVSVLLSPNPAQAGGTVHVSVSAIEVACLPRVEDYTSGEFSCGEV